MNPTRGINHAVLYVSDPQRSAAFYHEALGLEVAMADPAGRAVFLVSPLSGHDHDLGLFKVSGPKPPAGTVGLYHLAWEVGDIHELVEARTRLAKLGALVGESDHGSSKSLYAQDPDGIEFEVAWFLPAEHWPKDQMGTKPLDLAAEVAHWG